MAKISKHGGPTNALVSAPEPVAPTPVEALPAEVEVASERVLSVYDTMLRGQLQDLCRQRGLVAYGNKDELVARLVASDAAREDVAPAEAAEETTAEVVEG